MENKINELLNDVVNVVKEEYQLQSQSWNTYGKRVSEKVKTYKEQKPDLQTVQSEVKEEVTVFMGELKANMNRSFEKLKAAISKEQAN